MNIGGIEETVIETFIRADDIGIVAILVEEHFEGVTVSRPEGTYMLFIDCEGWCKAHNTGIETVLHGGWKYGVCWQDGRPFHGEYAIRMNLALPFARVQEAFERLDRYVFNAE